MHLLVHTPRVSEDRLRCTFDVRPDDMGLAEGTPELMTAILRALGVEAQVEEWRIDGMCTPYYSGSGTRPAPDFDVAWRVEVRTRAPIDPAHLPPPFLPTGIEEFDETWSLTETAWDCGRFPVWVIADFLTPPDPADVFGGPVPSGVTVETVDLGMYGTQLRMGVGARNHAGDDPDVRRVLARCEELGASTNWAISLAGSGKKLWIP